MDMRGESNRTVGCTMIYADVAQLAEQLICNQQVGSSSLPVSSTLQGILMKMLVIITTVIVVNLIYDWLKKK